MDRAKPKNNLENLLQTTVNEWAYPFGHYTPELVSIAKKAGYKNQLLVNFNCPEHKLDKNLEWRFGINPFIGHNAQIQCLLDGSY